MTLTGASGIEGRLTWTAAQTAEVSWADGAADRAAEQIARIDVDGRFRLSFRNAAGAALLVRRSAGSCFAQSGISHDEQAHGLVSPVAEAVPATTEAGTWRSVARSACAGRSASYAQREEQLHIRSTVARLDAAQAARIRAEIGQLPAHDVAAEYRRSLNHLSGAPTAVPRRLDWLAFAPLVVAHARPT